jgi:tetratricopeptide (TPR) repeat protein
LRQARVRYWQGRSHYLRNELREAIGLYQQVLAVGQEYGDEELLALPSSVIGRVLGVQGQFGKVTPLLKQAIPLLEKTGNWVDWIWAVGFQGLSLAGRGFYEEGVAEGQRALARAEEMKYLTGIAASRLLITATHLMAGMMQRVLDESQLVLEVAEQSGDRLYLYLGRGFQAWANSALGNHTASAESIAQRKAIAESLGGRLLLTDWFAASDADIALNAGNISDALALAEKAAGVARGVGGIFAEGVAERVWGQALARAETPEWDKIEEHLATSVRVFESGENILPAAYTELAWGIVSRNRGETTAARGHLEKAAEQFERSRLDAQLAHARGLLAELSVNQKA